jgi:hypothetical protein
MRRLIVLLAGLMVGGACGSGPVGDVGDVDLTAFFEEGARVHRGVISFFGDPIVVEVPRSAVQGETIAIRMMTWGDGCTRKAETRISGSELSFLVEPFDSVGPLAPNAVCDLILVGVEHEASLTLPVKGSVQVEIKGWALPENDMFSVKRRILVR